MPNRFLALIIASLLVLVIAIVLASTPGRPGALLDDAASLSTLKK